MEKLLSNYAIMQQESVYFMCSNENVYNKLIKEIKKIITKEDSVIIIHLTQEDFKNSIFLGRTNNKQSFYLQNFKLL